MSDVSTWTQESYQRSATSRAWACTPLDTWEACRDSPDVRRLYEQECRLGTVPAWAREIVRRMLSSPLPTCGHYSFPRSITSILDAIGREACPAFVIGCYTADPDRKGLLAYYVFCLDGWLKEADPALATAELLGRRERHGRDWPAIVQAVYRTLGPKTPPKALLIERLCHRMRWWMKTLMWEDDQRDVFMLDVYLGDVRGKDTGWGDYMGTSLRDPYFTEMKDPRVQGLCEQIGQIGPAAKRILQWIEDSQLCGPKFFRWLERIVAAIGAVDSPNGPGEVGGILGCQDLLPDASAWKQVFESLMADLGRWLDGDTSAVPTLGTVTPVKHWLVGLLRLRLQLYARHENFGKLVG